MFSISDEAVEYIKKRSGEIFILLTFEPAVGGWACSGKHVTGSYVPSVSLGSPPVSGLLAEEFAGVRIYYPQKLQAAKAGTAIKITLRRMLFLKWLELENAKVTVVYQEWLLAAFTVLACIWGDDKTFE